ncbi:MAG: hypothetical protein ACRC2K_06555 [Clostridium sp.]
MGNLEMLKKEYGEYLQAQMDFHKQEEIRLKNEGAKDESVFEKIKFNVVDIFSKMFNASCMKAMKNNNMDEVYQAYKGYYNNIPRSWRENLKKAREFNAVEDVTIEELKLAKLEEVFNVFEECFNKYKS